jgi:YHS domain-containing protein
MFWNPENFVYPFSTRRKKMFKKSSLQLFTGLALAAAMLLAGCSSETATTQPQAQSVSSDWKMGLDADVVAALSELSDSDRTGALSQNVCPVSGKQLGVMGKPPKVTIEGQEVYLCCDGCDSEIKSDPGKYLAKLSNN